MFERLKKLSAETKAKLVIGYILAILLTIGIGSMTSKTVLALGLFWLVWSAITLVLVVLYKTLVWEFE